MADVTKINGYIIKDANAPHPSNTGSAGQVLKKTETGTEWADATVPDWNQNDSTAADYVKNRPFYTGNPVETVLVEESTVAFTLNEQEGLYIAQFLSTFEAIVGETYEVSWDGTVYECTCVAFGPGCALGNLSIVGAGSDTGEPFVMGIMDGERIQIITADTSASHTFSISRTDVPVVKIDKKYLVQPDWNQNDETAADYVKNRPFYSETGNVTVENAIGNIVLERFPVFAIGDTVTVNVDGVEHSLVAYDDNGSAAIGDTSSSFESGEGQFGWSIYVINDPFEEVVRFFAKEMHTVSYLGIDYHHKIDPKYLPSSFKPDGKSYLTFSSLSSFTLAVSNTTKNWNGTLEYFASDRTWTVWDGTTTLSSVNNDGEYVLYLRGTGNTVITGNNSSNFRWVLTGSNIACIGNIENLLDYATIKSGAHPTMANSCYANMFYDCTSLTAAPALPATTLAKYCYYNMFRGCTSLTAAPALPATTMANSCYYNMFRGCTSLTQAPNLPAITLADHCYANMFQGCTSLTTTPALPATTLEVSCYTNMFYDCTNLTTAPALPATTLSNRCYENMFQGCTNLTQAPALPATTLANYCYANMFYDCTSLTQAPALPATTLAKYCYTNMFYGCTSLKLSSTQTDEYTQEYCIPSSGTGTTASNALTNMFTSTGGTFTGTPEINTTYYLSSDNMIVRETEIATLNGYVGSMIDAATESKIDVSMKGAAGGVASLGSDGKVPSTQLPSLDYIPTSQKGTANGVASLGADGKVPSTQLPSLDYIPTSQKGAANGVASLGSDGKVPSAQLPEMGGETHTATLTTSGWAAAGSYQKQTVTVTGLKASYPVSPVVDAQLSGTDADGDAAILTAFSAVNILQTAENQLIAYCIGVAPTTNIPLIINTWG